MIFLLNGVRLQGILTAFDKLSVELSREEQSRLVFKNAIATIVPNYPIQLHEKEE